MPGITGAPAALGTHLGNAWSYVKGQCTAFVAASATWVPPGLGDAADWLHNARIKGFQTTPTPTVGSVVVYGRGGGYNIASGHVALVTGIVDAAHFTVDEQNYDTRGSIHRGRVSDMRDVSGFILGPGMTAGQTNGQVFPASADVVGNAITGPFQAIGDGFATLGKDLAHIGWVFAGLVLVLLGFALLVVPEVIKKSPVPVPLP